ncbi:MAG TPA: cell division protein SepF [Kribbella sp.]|uniref:cell division protein SepF n=1 Tax=Kribbella sp. TaxID=1871183 RepID=UPI002D76C206|nr:cell division protein SepF [Kribbella sp.]HET6292942.1 cell division protein SepF [Kribbella sp.]
MSGALRKMGVYLGLVEDGERYNARYDDEYDDYEEYDDEAVDGESHETEPVAVPARSEEQVGTVSKFPDRRGVSASPEVTELARITTVHPRSYNEARVIGEHFRDGTPVIMNLTEMDHADAKRLVDFAAGLIFCCRGSIERITTKVFLVCPPNVTVAAEEKEKIAADGFYNQS